MNDALKGCVSVLEDLRDNVLVNNLPALASIQNALEKAYATDNAPVPVSNTVPVVATPPVPQVSVAPDEPTIDDRRTEPRDPGETDQHLAEEIGLVPPAK